MRKRILWYSRDSEYRRSVAGPLPPVDGTDVFAGGTRIVANRTYRNQERALRQAVHAPGPIWSNLPTPVSLLPLVLLTVAIVPALGAWFFGSLTPEQAEWGLLGLDALGRPGLLATEHASSPPLFAWLVATTLSLPWSDAFWTLTIPSYLCGLFALLLVYGIGRDWLSEGAGLLACLMLGLNGTFLEQVRYGAPGPCALMFGLAFIYSHLRHFRADDRIFSWWTLGQVGSLIGLALTVGPLGCWIVLVAPLHVLMEERRDRGLPFLAAFRRPATTASLFALAGVGLTLLFTAPVDVGVAGPFWPWSRMPWMQSVGWSDLLLSIPATVAPAFLAIWRA